MVKNLSKIQETWVQSLGQEDPLEKGVATHSSILAWESHGQRAWPAAVHRFAMSRTWLSRLALGKDCLWLWRFTMVLFQALALVFCSFPVCMQCDIRVQFHLFACGYPVGPSSFVGRTILCPLTCLGSLVESQLIISADICVFPKRCEIFWVVLFKENKAGYYRE